MQKTLVSYFDHPTARWFFACSDKGLEMVTVLPLKGAQEASKQPDFVQGHANALKQMLDGRYGTYPLPLHISGTPFQREVWRQIAQIPHGATIDYTALAHLAGNPKVVRAAASACGKNPVPIAIPCHRVLRADGSLGGFAFGLELKERMLKYEAAGLGKLAA